jgi:trimethylamine--corrinoid protein Co-methyltransferase
MWPAFLCGANFILHAAGWAEGALSMSYEKFIMDVEQCGAFHVIGGGLITDTNGLAHDAFLEVEPGKHFLGSAHTMKNYETAFYDFETSDNNSFEQWQDEGSLDIQVRANRKWKRVLADYVPPPLDEAKDEELRAVIDAKKAAVPDAWY